MTLDAAIARAAHARQNASRAVKKKRARPLERAPRYWPLRWRSDDDYTLFGAAVDWLLIRVGLSDWRW